MDAQQPSPLTRRELLKRAAALGGALAVGGAGSAAGVRAAQEPRFTGVTLNYMSHPGQILPIITHQVGYLREQYGLEIRILESPDPTSYLDAMRDLRTGGGRYDIVMHFPRYNGELAVTGYLRPLDDLIARYDAAPLFDNIVDAYRILYTQWEGKTITVPVDGDVAMLYYRKDALENPDYRRRFREKYGFDLRVPRTWDEFIKVAEFFTGWTWGPTGKPGYGFQTSTWERAFIEQQWAPMMASAGGNWLTKEGAHPAFNNRAGIRALQDLKTLLGFAPPGSISLSWGQTMETVFANDVALVLWYMDLGRLGWSPKSWFAQSGGPEKMKNFGYGFWPGYEVDGVYRNFNSMFYGRVVGISRFSKQADAAFQVLRTLLDPKRRVLSMDDPQSGSDMFLKTDYDPAVFKVLTPSPEFLKTAQAVIQNGFPELQLPGVGEYMDALQGELHAYLTGRTASPQQALNQAAERWEAITERWGRRKQAEYWLQVLGRYKEAGLKVAEL